MTTKEAVFRALNLLGYDKPVTLVLAEAERIANRSIPLSTMTQYRYMWHNEEYHEKPKFEDYLLLLQDVRDVVRKVGGFDNARQAIDLLEEFSKAA